MSILGNLSAQKHFSEFATPGYNDAGVWKTAAQRKALALAALGVTATAAELGVLDSVTAGTVAASKALVVDANKDLASLRNLTLTGSLTSAGVAAITGQTVFAANIATGNIPAQVSTDGNDTTPSVTETYVAAVTIPANCTVTGVRIFNGSAVAGNVTAYLYDSTGANVAATASTAQSGTDAYQQIAFSSPYSAKGPATYFVGLQFNNTSARFNTHAFGAFPAFKKTGETYGTPTTLTPVATFTANQGPMANLY